MKWEFLHLKAHQLVGYIPDFVDDRNPASAAEQFNHNYNHGGGWRPFQGFTFNPERLTIKYPGDPALKAIARAKLREETILVFEDAWVLILQPDGTFEISRMD